MTKKCIFFLSLFFGMFGMFQTAFAQQAILYFVPASGTIAPGQNFALSVFVDTKGEAVNAVAAHFSYPEATIEILGVQPEAGLIEFHKSAGAGVVKVDVAKTSPYIVGVQRIATVTARMRPTAQGASTFAFRDDSAVLRNTDSQNILVLASSGNATFQVGQAVVPPPTPPPPPPTTPPPTPPTPTPGPSPGPEPGTLSISDIRVEKLSDESALLSFRTSEEARSSVTYGPSTQEDYPFSALDGELGTEHSFVLSNVKFSEDYLLDIIATDELGNQATAERLLLGDLLRQEEEAPPPGPLNGEIEIGGFEIRPSMLILFIGLPIGVILLGGFLLFLRMKARAEG